jgi:hypothetical protein
MNIGEISKPSVERAQVSTKVEQQSTNPVTESKQVVDSVHLSDESKRRFKKREQSKNSHKQANDKTQSAKSVDAQQSSDALLEQKKPANKGLKIDLRA